ncbi:MAG: serine/threonine protein kinase [Rhodoferax sp.]
MPESVHALARPFAGLTALVVLDALASVGLDCDGRLLALNSFENRVYRAHLSDGRGVVAKFYRPGRWSAEQILEEHAFAQALAQAEVPVVAPLLLQGRSLHRHLDWWFSVSPWRGGRRPETHEADTLEWIGRFVARLHTVGAQDRFVAREALTAQTLGVRSRDWLLAHDALPLSVATRWADACQDALDCIAATAIWTVDSGQRDLQHGVRWLRLHGDVHAGNILWTPTEAPAAAGPGPHFVDLDDCRMGPAVQDLWTLLDGDPSEHRWQWACLLDGYTQVRDFDDVRERALVEPLRTLRLIHYSAWLAQRWQDPIFAQNFPWFGSEDYWEDQIALLRAQLDAMQKPPSWT